MICFSVSYLAYLSKLERKTITRCGGWYSGLLMLLCPWLLSLLYNKLKTIFWRGFFIIYFLAFIYVWNNTAFVALNKVQWLWWWKSCGRNPPEYHINILLKLVFREKQTKAVLYILIQASASQYWITRELLSCFYMQHMIYYCTFCCTIRASEDSANSNCFCLFVFH